MRTLYIFFSFLLLVSVSNITNAQCSSCTYTVSSNSSAGYNLNSGQTLCILAGVNYNGDINLNGGTLCNNGNITGGNINFNSGKIYNYGTFNKSGSLGFNGEFHNYGTLNISGDLNMNSSGAFYNYSAGKLTVTGNVSNNYIFVNQGTATVNGTYNANGSSTLNQNSGTLNVSGDFNINRPFTNSGTISVNGSVAVNSGASFTNTTATSTLNVNNNYTNNGATTNNGTINIGKNFTNNGSAIYTNNTTTKVLGNFTNNGSINGDAVGCNSFSVYGGSVVQNSSGSITNNDFCSNGVPSRFSTNTGTVSPNVTYCNCTNNGITPLPIILTSFTATCVNGEKVKIDWTTATEINNAFFTISRSTDLASWEMVEVVEGAGNSNQERNYSITDSRNISGVSYYRIHQTDLDGTMEYFSPVSVNCDASSENAVLVYPNPADEQFTVSVTSSQNTNGSIHIYDIAGKKVLSRNVSYQTGTNLITFDRTGLGSGTYIIHVISKENILDIQKLILR